MEKQKNIPALRFPGFFKEWKLKDLSEIAKVSSGGTPSRGNPNYWSGTIPWVSTTLINFNTINNADEYITKEGLENSSAKLFPIGTLLMAMYGQGKTRGKVAILGIEASTNQACAAIIPEIKTIDGLFLFQNLAGRYDEIRNLSNQGGQENLSGELIKGLSIIFPTLPEQQKIASFLTSVDTRLTQLKQKKNLLEQYKKGVMQKLFSREIRFRPALSEVEGDDEGREFPEWELKPLSKIVKILYGKDQKQVIDDNGKFPILGTGGIIGMTNKYLYDKPSVLIGRKGTIDKPVYMDTPFWTVDTLFYTEVFTNTLAKWLYYRFQTINWYLYNEASGVPSLSGSTIYKIEIELPCVPEQTKIANFLTSLDEKISQCSSQIEKTELWKKGLLQQMFV